MAEDKARKLVANNKKAYHDYFIEEKYEAGIELFGTEVKSIRQGKCSIKEAWISIDKGEAFRVEFYSSSGLWREVHVVASKAWTYWREGPSNTS